MIGNLEYYELLGPIKVTSLWAAALSLFAAILVKKGALAA